MNVGEMEKIAEPSETNTIWSNEKKSFIYGKCESKQKT